MDNFDSQEKMQKLSYRPSTDTCRFFWFAFGLVWEFLLFVLEVFCFIGFFVVVGFWGFLNVFAFNTKQKNVLGFKSLLSLGSNHMVCTKEKYFGHSLHILFYHAKKSIALFY